MSATLVKGAPLRTVKRMVIGFLFDEMKRVLLVQKKKPSWQSGRWNGIGGKVEPNESFEHAMAREFYEETGILIAISDWQNFASIESEGDFEIEMFAAEWLNNKFNSLEQGIYSQSFPEYNDGGEKLGAYFSHSIDHLPLVEHMTWLVPLALDTILYPDAINYTVMATGPNQPKQVFLDGLKSRGLIK